MTEGTGLLIIAVAFGTMFLILAQSILGHALSLGGI